MKRMLLGLALLSLTSLGFAQGKGIGFEQNLNWTQIKAKAKAENKYIFMDVFATWCGPCKQMDKEVYPIEKVGAFMNDKFIAVKVQSDKTKDDSEHIKKWYKDSEEIISAYKVEAYPSYLYFSPDGKLINCDIGFKSPEEFISSAAAAIDSSKKITDKVEKFNRHQMDYVLMPDLVRKAKSLNRLEFAQKVADEYINKYLMQLKDQELYTKNNLSFIGNYLGNENSKAFKLFIKEPEKVNQVLGGYAAQGYLMNYINKKYLPREDDYKKIEVTRWDALENIVTAKFGALGKETIYAQRMIYHYAKQDWKNFGIWYQKYFEIGLQHTHIHVNNISWVLFEHVDDPQILSFACEVMKYAIENLPYNDCQALDTYANLLHKAGKTIEAIKWEEKALKLAKGNGHLEGLFNVALEKMQKNEKTWKETVSNP